MDSYACGQISRSQWFSLFVKRRREDYEGRVLLFLAGKTSAPVPTFVDSVQLDNGQFLLVTSCMPGQTLRGLPPEYVGQFSTQLKAILAQIRSIPPPGPGVCRIDGAATRDFRLSLDRHPWGSYTSVLDFKTRMVEESRLVVDADRAEEVYVLIEKSHSKDHRVCFTHADIHPFNFLVDDEYNITGLVDWELAGWLPEYWEYAKSVYVSFQRQGRWFDVMSDVLPGYTDELVADRAIMDWRQTYG